MSEPNPFPTMIKFKEELIKRYSQSKWYKKPVWLVGLLIFLIIILIEMKIIINI